MKYMFYFVFCYQGGCIAKLENFIMDHLKLIGAVGVGVASVQVRQFGLVVCMFVCPAPSPLASCTYPLTLSKFGF